ncbi:guanitoxin biosynthesis heme-dependent pre-guanitoxin N-hydroxylase GntA [Salegentibacter sp. F188]|uniref:Guanitoxin biosynthesis heme-dependent pre-guanitoxin N-hydroxylase GntA n=1 Tax=Autumnicola patrickiae TaxID=3075591 RepID=A0ABU3E672_9FLAO|nr:guanitoxin biosynthesis heme-dependent pre-guanitoxin N-hydroxylase GntA [Salegentibacter sp. F188]MDT0691491.1 guanitoxin biosynthesis heme-dependent pre-guanitoxin N-hydroxylase GntA [Salegentibacter sp. F188]
MLVKKEKIEKNPPVTDNSEKDLEKDFHDFIIADDHPCVMAQTVFSMDHVDFHAYNNFGSKEAAKEILEDLKKYIAKYDFESNDFFTFLAAFKGNESYTEEEFEKLLWQQLNFLHKVDDTAWDKNVSDDPEDGNFSFSLGGRAFYIVGLHPNSSRMARQTPYPAIAFNLHWQFEKLREMGTYHTVRNKIRERDSELQGSINPMLRDFGVNSEARQYSGRKVGEEWKCPFLNSKN